MAESKNSKKARMRIPSKNLKNCRQISRKSSTAEQKQKIPPDEKQGKGARFHGSM